MLLAVITQAGSNAFIVLSYHINTLSFAKDCENKLRPQLHCNGRCQMVKKLQSEENPNGHNIERKISNEVNAFISFFCTVSPPFTAVQYAHFLIIDDKNCKKMPRDCFHPPCVPVLT